MEINLCSVAAANHYANARAGQRTVFSREKRSEGCDAAGLADNSYKIPKRFLGVTDIVIRHEQDAVDETLSNRKNQLSHLARRE